MHFIVLSDCFLESNSDVHLAKKDLCSFIFFLISSSNLNQLYKRKQYLNQLTVHRTNQINKIKVSRGTIEK